MAIGVQFKKEIRMERGPEIYLTDKEREIPKRLYKYLKSKKVTKERVNPIEDQ